jgi:predicted transcriptional regulator
MASMSFRVPEKVKKAFDAAFAKENKSAIMARMMMQAVEEEKSRARQAKAIDRALARRITRKTVSQKEFPAVRKKLRK